MSLIPTSTILGWNVENFFLLPRKRSGRRDSSTEVQPAAARRQQVERNRRNRERLSCHELPGLLKKGGLVALPGSKKGEAFPLGRKTTGNQGFSPLTGGKKGDTVFPNSKRQRTGRVAAGRSQEKGRVVQVLAYAGGEGAWEPRGGNALPSALVTGESALSLLGKRIQVGPRMIVIRPEAGKRLRGVFLLPKAVFHKILTNCVKGDKET